MMKISITQDNYKLKLYFAAILSSVMAYSCGSQYLQVATPSSQLSNNLKVVFKDGDCLIQISDPKARDVSTLRVEKLEVDFRNEDVQRTIVVPTKSQIIDPDSKEVKFEDCVPPMVKPGNSQFKLRLTTTNEKNNKKVHVSTSYVQYSRNSDEFYETDSITPKHLRKPLEKWEANSLWCKDTLTWCNISGQKYMNIRLRAELTLDPIASSGLGDNHLESGSIYKGGGISYHPFTFWNRKSNLLSRGLSGLGVSLSFFAGDKFKMTKGSEDINKIKNKKRNVYMRYGYGAAFTMLDDTLSIGFLTMCFDKEKTFKNRFVNNDNDTESIIYIGINIADATRNFISFLED